MDTVADALFGLRYAIAYLLTAFAFFVRLLASPLIFATALLLWLSQVTLPRGFGWSDCKHDAKTLLEVRRGEKPILCRNCRCTLNAENTMFCADTCDSCYQN